MARAPREAVDVKTLLLEIRRDPKYKKFKTIVETTRSRLKIEADRNEALALHSSRTSRTLSGKKQYSGAAILDAEATELYTRSRLVQIRVQASIHLDLLDEACDAIKRHIFTQYHEDLLGFTNEQQRRALIERVQGAALELIAEGKSLKDMLDQIIKDVDQANFHLGHMVSTLEMLHNSKGKVL
jgi:hypothetical protein